MTLERVVGIAPGALPQREQLPQALRAKVAFHVLSRVDYTAAQALLVALPLEDLLLDAARRDEAVHEAVLLLAVAPHARQRLLICRRVPVRIEQDQAVGADEVDTAAAGLG